MAAILFVVGSTTLTAGNTAIRDAIIAAGHTVTVRASSSADKSTTGFAAAVLASDTSSADLVGYATSSAGLVILQHAVWDEAKLWTGGEWASSFAEVVQATILGSHAIVTGSGLSGTFTAYSPGQSARYLMAGNMVAAAVPLIAWAGVVPSDNIGAWALDAGATLSDGSTAAGRRVAGPLLSESAAAATPSLLNLLKSAVNWAAGVGGGGGSAPTVPDPAVSEVVTITANPTGGTSPYTYAFTQTAGPTVTLSGSGNSRSFTRPANQTADIVVQVTVTGANSLGTTKTVTIKPPATVSGSGKKRWNGTAWVTS